MISSRTNTPEPDSNITPLNASESPPSTSTQPISEPLSSQSPGDLSPVTAGLAAVAASLSTNSSEIEVENVGVCQLLGQTKSVLTEPVFVFISLGAAANQFITGGFAFWAPAYLVEYIKVDKMTAGLGLAADLALAGTFGTVLGGTLLDICTTMAARRASRAGREVRDGIRCAIGCQLAFIFALLTIPVTLAAVTTDRAIIYFTALGFSMLIMFGAAAPAIVSQMESVPPHLRGLAMAMNTLGIHLLGDMISPTLVGKIADVKGSLRYGMWVLSAWTVFPAIFIFTAAVLAACQIGMCRCCGDGDLAQVDALTNTRVRSARAD